MTKSTKPEEHNVLQRRQKGGGASNDHTQHVHKIGEVRPLGFRSSQVPRRTSNRQVIVITPKLRTDGRIPR